MYLYPNYMRQCPSGSISYSIKPRDTLYIIARKHDISLNEIIDVNPGINPYMLMVGQQICIPFKCKASAIGLCAYAEGCNTKAVGECSHSEGADTEAWGSSSHTEGYRTVSRGNDAHAEGTETEASGSSSHAEGYRTIASGNDAHAEGTETEASGSSSHAEGYNTSTNGFRGAHIMGKYGEACEEYSWFMANGINEDSKGISACIKNNGEAFFAGTVSPGTACPCADYAEMFETIDGKPIDAGYYVTLEGNKIRKATASDQYILGVTTVTPAILGDSAALGWKNKYMTDEWGRVLYHEVDVSGKIEKHPILNPKWDPSKAYVPRIERPEWMAVALVGKVLLRDDGTSQENGYCKPNDEGVAMASSEGYRVLKRMGRNQILVLFR
ncbi:peptidase G2 autoproteolytic cleavage domain-containing protein [Anaerosolibacter sp.]|uniref:peptidase G2 autoproteolytic cleavage domain-containing protein n=1 Tax=Anaerosolibacter sp. TaxID=1872527 RepID=UPI0039EF8F0E